MTLARAAGIDVGQRFLDVGLAPSGKSFRLKNIGAAFDDLIERLRRESVVRVVIEAVGGYAQPLVDALARAGFEISIVNPRRIKAFRDAEGKRAKTDRLDAGLMARFALVMTDALRPLPDESQRALKALSVRRRQLTELIAIEKTRLKQALEPLVAASHKAAITELSALCAAIEAEIDARIAADPQAAEKKRLLLSIPGIGPRVAGILLTELPELGDRDRKAIASLAGLAPHVFQTGNTPPRAAIVGGRPCVRNALYMSALVAARHDPHLKAVYAELRLQGKPAKVALIALARRILITANAIVKAKTPYQRPQHP